MPLPKSDYVSEVWKDGIFNNKVVFCTGGAGTICSAQVRALVHLGANACIIGRSVEKTENAAKDIATARKGAKVIGMGDIDVRSVESLQKAVDRTLKELGSIDFVICGAAGNFLSPIGHLSSNAFKAVIEIDLVGSFNTMKVTLPHLRESAAKHLSDGKKPNPAGTGGRILFVSATLHYAGVPLQTHAMAAKAGIDALSSGLCIEEGPRGVTSNVVAPGAIAETEGMARLAPDGGGAAVRTIPSGRMGTVKEIADSTVYLFSDAGNYVNGTSIVVDGGGWRTMAQPGGEEFRYPDFLLAGDEVTGVKGTKKSKM